MWRILSMPLQWDYDGLLEYTQCLICIFNNQKFKCVSIAVLLHESAKKNTFPQMSWHLEHLFLTNFYCCFLFHLHSRNSWELSYEFFWGEKRKKEGNRREGKENKKGSHFFLVIIFISIVFLLLFWN